MGKFFGTDGIRGLVNKEPLTADTALRLGKAIAYLCRQSNGRNKIVRL